MTNNGSPDREALLTAARVAATHSWAPYSHFRVGSAVAIKGPWGPRVVTGANVENYAYGLTLCAERAALAAACQLVGPGQRPSVMAVAVVGLDAPQGQCTPCGACRQWFAELAPDADYYIDGIEKTLHLADLLPHAPTGGSFWPSDRQKVDPIPVFISYSHKDVDFANRLIMDLGEKAIRDKYADYTNYFAVWLDHENLPVGTPDWQKEIRRAIKLSKGVLYVASEDAASSPYVHDELAIAQDNDVPVYPIWARGNKWSDCVPIGWGKTQYEDARGAQYDMAVKAIISRLLES